MSAAQLDRAEGVSKRIDDLLEQEPSGHDEVLREIHEDLGTLRKDSDIKVLEKIYQSLGTAVGQHSMIARMHHRAQHHLTLAQKGGKRRSETQVFWRQY